MPGHGSCVEINVVKNIGKTHSCFIPQALIDVFALYLNGFYGFEIILPDIVISDIAVKKRIYTLEFNCGICLNISFAVLVE